MSVSKDFYKNPLAELTNTLSSSKKTEAFTTNRYGSFESQKNLIGDLVNKHESIETTKTTYTNNRDKIINAKHTSGEKKDEKKYKDYEYYYSEGDPTKSEVNPSDNSVSDKRIWLDLHDRKPDIKDATKEDLHTMIVQQNNAYIVGMITLVTILITTFLTLKK